MHDLARLVWFCCRDWSFEPAFVEVEPIGQAEDGHHRQKDDKCTHQTLLGTPAGVIGVTPPGRHSQFCRHAFAVSVDCRKAVPLIIVILFGQGRGRGFDPRNVFVDALQKLVGFLGLFALRVWRF